MTTPNKLHADATKHRMAERGISSRKLAELTGIPYGTIRNAVAGRDVIRLDRIYAIAHHLVRDGEDVRDVVAEIAYASDGTPDTPPKQPSKPTSPPKRSTTERTKGPKRLTGAVV